ncbi:MAG TPA: hypothetical protein DCF68_22700 [Cyanothece sp. UBA12306]|nr:hypothetical protein [Cyanothece sp. UBA12306]
MEIQTTQSTEKIQAWLVSYLAELLEIEPSEIDVSAAFDRYGLDSSTGISMMADLEEWLGQEIEPTIMFDFNTIESLARNLSEVNGQVNQLEQTQGIEPENNKPNLSNESKNSDYIEVEL